MYCINFRYHNKIETIDQFETEEEANKMLSEYRISDKTGQYYISLIPLEGQIDTENNKQIQQ